MRDLDINAHTIPEDKLNEHIAEIKPEMTDVSIRHFTNKTLTLPKIAGTYKIENISNSTVTIPSKASIVTCHNCNFIVHEYIPHTYMCVNTKFTLQSHADEQRFGAGAMNIDTTNNSWTDNSSVLQKPC